MTLSALVATAKTDAVKDAMQVFMTTTDDLDRQEIPTGNLVNLEIKIGKVVYQLSEREGQLRVSVAGQLVAKPGGANILLLSSDF